MPNRLRGMLGRRWVRVAFVVALVAAAGTIFIVLAKSEWADFASIALARHQRALRADTIEIATVWAKGDPSLAIGARIAAEEAGDVVLESPKDLGEAKKKRRIAITAFEVPAAKETKMARVIARNPRFVAVIGHTTSEISNLSSISYEQTGLVFIAVNATDPLLTQHDGFDYIFRIAPTDQEINEVLATVAGRISLTNPGRVGILYTLTGHYVNTPYLSDLAGELSAQTAPPPAFESQYAPGLSAPPKGWLTTISDGRYGYGRKWIDHLRQLDAMRNAVSRMYDDERPLGTLLLLDDYPANARIVINRVQRTMPVSEHTVIAGGLGLDNVDRRATPPVPCTDWSELVHNPAVGLDVPLNKLRVLAVTPLCMAQARRVIEEFEKRKVRNYYAAWQGYRAVMLIAEALRKSESIAPIDLSAVLRSGTPFAALDNASFTRRGDVEGQKLYIKAVDYPIPARSGAMVPGAADKPKR